MKLNLSFSVLLLSVLFIFSSCKKEEEAEAEVATSVAPKQIIVPNVQPIPDQNYNQQQAVTVPQNQTVITPQSVPTQVATKPGMNPAHGQPGHRCDIAVGAPLNSPVKAQPKPAGGGATITNSIPVTTSVTTPNQSTPAILTTDTPAATPAGMNPPHGQPGHVCGTPVGSALPKATESK